MRQSALRAEDEELEPAGSPRTGGLVTINEETPTEEFIAWTLERFRRQRMVITTSFGMEGCALIDMYARHGEPIEVVYLDTGFFFPETHELRRRMEKRYSRVRFVNRGTDLSPEEQERRYGPVLWERNPDLCCELRKVLPMQKLLSGVDVWVTSIGRSQSAERSKVQLVEWDWKFQLLKVNPLINWTRQEIWDYVRAHDVPYNELHERGYPTVGCTHCTVPVKGARPGEYTRLGRWAGKEKTECGLHLSP